MTVERCMFAAVMFGRADGQGSLGLNGLPLIADGSSINPL